MVGNEQAKKLKRKQTKGEMLLCNFSFLMSDNFLMNVKEVEFFNFSFIIFQSNKIEIIDCCFFDEDKCMWSLLTSY